MKTLIAIISLLAIHTVSGQLKVIGTVSDSSNLKALHGAHIVNLNAKKFTISELNGSFEIPASKGDTLLITHVGYQNKRLLVTGADEFPIKLIPETLILDEVRVSNFPSYRHFKQLIIDTQPMDSSLVVFGMNAIPMEYFTQEDVTEEDLQQPFFGPSIGIGFDLEPMTKRGKEKRKMEKILARKELEKVAYRKFNRDWVADQTKLKGDDLTDFIAYCDFSIEFLVNTSLFEIHQEMMTLLDEFISKQSDDQKNHYTPGA